MSEAVRFLKPICPQGHDKRVVGVYGYSCAACAAETQRRRRASGARPKMRSPFCRRGHDKRAVGTAGHGNACRECARASWRRYRHRERAERHGAPLGFFEDFGRRGPLRLRPVRESLGLSRRALERLSGVSRFTIADIERGRSRGWPTTRKKLVDALAPLLAERARRLEKAGMA